MNTHYTLSQIFQPIEAALVEARLIVNQLWRESLAFATAPEDNTQSSEGKLLRPALCLLAAGALDAGDLKRYASLAAAYEVIHMASLAHDDVVDHAELRRGQNSLNARWNNHTAILCGDYLVARGIELINSYKIPELNASALEAVRHMAAGELRFYGRDPATAPEADCIVLAESKTASLFAAACSAPALLIAPEQTQALRVFGINLGTAFQLVDDLLDITQPVQTLGKPACGDIVEGKHTLPLFLLRQALTTAERERLSALRGAEATEADCLWIQERVKDTGVDVEVGRRARLYMDKGLHALESLPTSPYRDSMIALAEFVLCRQA